MARAVALALCLVFLASALQAEPASPEMVRELAPTGRLRAAINYGNVVLAQRGQDGEPTGVSVDLARELARRLGVPLDFIAYEAAAQVAEAASEGAWDVAFLAIDPLRAAAIEFTPPYVLIEGTYVVPEASPLRTAADIDREDVEVAVGRGSAYDLFLTRQLKRATIVRAVTSADAIKLFVENKLAAVAGVKQPLVAFVKETPGFRLIDGRFMAIEQAMGVPKGRPLGLRYLRDFVEEMKASGFVAASLQRHRQPEAVVAPPAGAP